MVSFFNIFNFCNVPKNVSSTPRNFVYFHRKLLFTNRFHNYNLFGISCSPLVQFSSFSQFNFHTIAFFTNHQLFKFTNFFLTAFFNTKAKFLTSVNFVTYMFGDIFVYNSFYLAQVVNSNFRFFNRTGRRHSLLLFSFFSSSFLTFSAYYLAKWFQFSFKFFSIAYRFFFKFKFKLFLNLPLSVFNYHIKFQKSWFSFFWFCLKSLKILFFLYYVKLQNSFYFLSFSKFLVRDIFFNINFFYLTKFYKSLQFGRYKSLQLGRRLNFLKSRARLPISPIMPRVANYYLLSNFYRYLKTNKVVNSARKTALITYSFFLKSCDIPFNQKLSQPFSFIFILYSGFNQFTKLDKKKTYFFFQNLKISWHFYKDHTKTRPSILSSILFLPKRVRGFLIYKRLYIFHGKKLLTNIFNNYFKISSHFWSFFVKKQRVISHIFDINFRKFFINISVKFFSLNFLYNFRQVFLSILLLSRTLGVFLFNFQSLVVYFYKLLNYFKLLILLRKLKYSTFLSSTFSLKTRFAFKFLTLFSQITRKVFHGYFCNFFSKSLLSVFVKKKLILLKHPFWYQSKFRDIFTDKFKCSFFFLASKTRVHFSKYFTSLVFLQKQKQKVFPIYPNLIKFSMFNYYLNYRVRSRKFFLLYFSHFYKGSGLLFNFIAISSRFNFFKLGLSLKLYFVIFAKLKKFALKNSIYFLSVFFRVSNIKYNFSNFHRNPRFHYSLYSNYRKLFHKSSSYLGNPSSLSVKLVSHKLKFFLNQSTFSNNLQLFHKLFSSRTVALSNLALAFFFSRHFSLKIMHLVVRKNLKNLFKTFSKLFRLVSYERVAIKSKLYLVKGSYASLQVFKPYSGFEVENLGVMSYLFFNFLKLYSLNFLKPVRSLFLNQTFSIFQNFNFNYNSSLNMLLKKYNNLFFNFFKLFNIIFALLFLTNFLIFKFQLVFLNSYFFLEKQLLNFFYFQIYYVTLFFFDFGISYFPFYFQRVIAQRFFSHKIQVILSKFDSLARLHFTQFILKSFTISYKNRLALSRVEQNLLSFNKFLLVLPLIFRSTTFRNWHGFQKQRKFVAYNSNPLAYWILIALINSSFLLFDRDLSRQIQITHSRLKKIKSYRGMRLLLLLPSHGQRTHTNAMTARRMASRKNSSFRRKRYSEKTNILEY